MLTVLKELERLTASTRFADMVTLTDLVEWVGKDPDRVNVLCRVLVLVMAAGQLDSQDLTAMITQMHSAERDRRKPIKLIKEPGDRLSQRLF